MEPIVAGGLVLGTTVIALVFVGLCSAVAERLYARFFSRQDLEPPHQAEGRIPGDQRRSA